MSKESAKAFLNANNAREVEEVTLKEDFGNNKKGDKVKVHKSVAKRMKDRKIA